MLLRYQYSPDHTTPEGHLCDIGCDRHYEISVAQRIKNPLASAAFTFIHPDRAAGDSAQPRRALMVEPPLEIETTTVLDMAQDSSDLLAV